MGRKLIPEAARLIVSRDVTDYIGRHEARPRPRGDHALTPAERSAAYRERLKAEAAAPKPIVRYHKAADRRRRPQRWRDAVTELFDLQADYVAWLEALPDSVRDTATADALRAIAEFDLSELEALEPPRGFGRD